MPLPRKFVIIPVAIPGSGKTTLAKALVYLFPSWGHFQNDLVSGKGPKAKLLEQQCANFLAPPSTDQHNSARVVFVDRNNHLLAQRKSLTTNIKALMDTTTNADNELVYICLNFAPNGPRSHIKTQWSNIKDQSLARIFKRGDSHPTIHAATRDNDQVHKIVGMFVRTLQAVDSRKEPDSVFDLVLDLHANEEDSTRKNLKKVVDWLREKYGNEVIPEQITDEQLNKAFQVALEPDEKAVAMPTAKPTVKPTSKPTLKLAAKRPVTEPIDLTESPDCTSPIDLTASTDYTVPIDLTKSTDLIESPPTSVYVVRDQNVSKLVDHFLTTTSNVDAFPARSRWRKLKQENKVLQTFQVFLDRKPIAEPSLKKRKNDNLELLTIKSLVFNDSLIGLNVSYAFEDSIKETILVLASKGPTELSSFTAVPWSNSATLTCAP